ncbi:hypothetical protein H9Q69_008154 [Fusarium xylarioides]|nr:hypothetical protein H9Q69_008154 [Fusarium xylarioides]
MPDDDAAIELEEYTVGWLCALPFEMAAAKGMLDRIHPDLCEQDPYDHNSYTLGEIQGHYVVIACLPAKNHGSCSVATVVKDLQRTFKSIRFGCDKSHIIHRPDRDDTDPYFHYGIIASASAAVKDGQTRQRLSQEHGAMCFETEAAGLYDFPCLIIRGIYDYADSHTQDLWQEYASATAAAFAKELLLFVAPGRIRREEKAFHEVASTAYKGFEIPVQSLAQQNYIRHMLNNQPMSLYMVDSARYDSEGNQESTRYEDGTRPLGLEAIEK